MFKIYRSGDQNLIWLGEDHGTVQVTIQALDAMTRHIEQTMNEVETSSTSASNNEYEELNDPFSIPSDIDLAPILRVCAKPWFSRFWVVQEAALSKENVCHCGPYTFDFLPLLRAAHWLFAGELPLDLNQFGESMVKTLHRVNLTSCYADPECESHSESDSDVEVVVTAEEPTFTAILWMLGNFDASEPQDHIFGTLALYQKLNMHGEVPPLLRPNYTKTVSDVFRDATRYALKETKTLAVFDKIGDWELGSPMPLWVPDWSQAESADLGPTSFKGALCNAHGGRPATFEWQLDDPSKLPIRGVPLGSVRSLSQSCKDFSTLDLFVDQVNDMANAYGLSTDSHDVQMAIATTLCGGANGDRSKATNDDLEGWTDLCKYRAESGRLPPSVQRVRFTDRPQQSSSVSKPANFLHAAQLACSLRRFFMTTDGRMGLGPQATQIGDVVAILSGCQWPLVLRRCGEEYELVGQSHVHGVMDGELTKMHEQHNKQDVLFVLR